MDSNEPDFPTWERKTLDQFAAEAYRQLRADAELIEQLRQDLRTALDAYRTAVTVGGVSPRHKLHIPGPLEDAAINKGIADDPDTMALA